MSRRNWDGLAGRRSRRRLRIKTGAGSRPRVSGRRVSRSTAPPSNGGAGTSRGSESCAHWRWRLDPAWRRRLEAIIGHGHNAITNGNSASASDAPCLARLARSSRYSEATPKLVAVTAVRAPNDLVLRRAVRAPNDLVLRRLLRSRRPRRAARERPSRPFACRKGRLRTRWTGVTTPPWQLHSKAQSPADEHHLRCTYGGRYERQHRQRVTFLHRLFRNARHRPLWR
jgi:hypothetical protein